MSRTKSSVQKVKLQRWVTVEQAAAVEALLAGSPQPVQSPATLQVRAEEMVQTLHSMNVDERRELLARVTMTELKSLKELALQRQCFEAAAILSDAIKLREQELKGIVSGEDQRAGHAGNASGVLVSAVEKNSTATPSGDVHGAGPAAGLVHRYDPDSGKYVAAISEQLALQSKRADDLQMQVDDLQHALDRKEVEMDQLMQTGGTERQSAYIARLLAKITALGGDKKEFDQT